MRMDSSVLALPNRKMLGPVVQKAKSIIQKHAALARVGAVGQGATHQQTERGADPRIDAGSPAAMEYGQGGPRRNSLGIRCRKRQSGRIGAANPLENRTKEHLVGSSAS